MLCYGLVHHCRQLLRQPLRHCRCRQPLRHCRCRQPLRHCRRLRRHVSSAAAAAATSSAAAAFAISFTAVCTAADRVADRGTTVCTITIIADRTAHDTTAVVHTAALRAAAHCAATHRTAARRTAAHRTAVNYGEPKGHTHGSSGAGAFRDR